MTVLRIIVEDVYYTSEKTEDMIKEILSEVSIKVLNIRRVPNYFKEAYQSKRGGRYE